MKVHIITDMEGCSGVVKECQLHGINTPVERGGKILAIETNAAANAAFESGADEVIIANGHVAPEEMLWDLLDPRPKYILGANTATAMDQNVDAIGFVGQHAMYTSGGVLEHTFDMKNYYEVKLNGITVGEAGFMAAVAGDYGIPIAFLAGDDACCREIEELIPGVATAAVKQSISRNAAISLHPLAAAKLIAEAAAKGLSSLDKIKPWKINGPIETVINYTSCAPVERNTQVPGVERASARGVRYVSDNVIEAFKTFALLGSIA